MKARNTKHLDTAENAHKMLNLKRTHKKKPKPNQNLRTIHMYVYHCALCTTVVHNREQISSQNLSCRHSSLERNRDNNFTELIESVRYAQTTMIAYYIRQVNGVNGEIYCDALISFHPSVTTVNTQYLDANISKRFEIETWYQLTTNRKWPMADRMMTSSMTSRGRERSRS